MDQLNFTPIPSHGRGIVLRLLQESYNRLPQIDERLIAEWEDGWRGYDDDIFTYPDTIGATGFVTCHGETIVGFASWDPRQHPVATIGHNCVLPAFRGNGYGRRQIEELLRRLMASGFRKARVTTGDHPGFIAAQQMYLSCGFREVGRFVEPTKTDASWKMVAFVTEL